MSYEAGDSASGKSRRLADRLAAGETILSAWSSLPDPLTIEAVAAAPLDAVTLDGQHGGHTEDIVLRAIGPVMARGKPAIVRIPVGRFDMASRVLDFGAEAVIAPMINSIADAKAFAAAMKYPPVGQRSWGAPRAQHFHGVTDKQNWLETANALSLAFAMIETREAYAALDGILAVDGIDGVFVGPGDLSISLSGGKTIDPGMATMMDTIADIGRRAVAAGKHAAIYLHDAALAGRYHRGGFRFFALTGDTHYISVGAKAQADAARASMS
ncbi:MAG: 2,4-dihydroxyhept-2-ene-1,7-dioic acid aldolase [Phyllobacteriaceae bacterium]|nr:2,4-dihydroxyhept-2-ene-1,7-dioic acid aldolase [Phyllobacteriaceae bacterium]